MSGFAYNELGQAKKRLIPLGQKLAESDDDDGQMEHEIELTADFLKMNDGKCKVPKENPFKKVKKIIIPKEKLYHQEVKCMKAAAIEGLKAGNSSITSLINNYRFSDKRGQELQLDLRRSLFEGTHEQQLAVFQAGRKKQIDKQKATINEKFTGAFNAVQRSALIQIVKTVDGFLQANEERIVSKASYLNEYVDFLLTVLLLGFHNTDVKIKDLEEQLHTLLTMDPNKAGLREVVKQQKGQQEFRESCCDKISELEKRISEMEKSNTIIDDSKPSVSQPVVESNANDNKITILFQLINELSKEVDALDVKQDSNVRKMIKEKFDKLKCFFRPSATSKTPEQQETCNIKTRDTLENMGINYDTVTGDLTASFGGRKKKTRRKKLRKNKISLKRKHLKFKKIKGGKRFKITKKKRNKRSRKIYYKKH